MSFIVGAVTIKAGVPTNFLCPSGGILGVIVSNESGFTCDIAMDGCSIKKRLAPGTADFFPAISGFNGNLLINPLALLSTARHYPDTRLTFEAVGITEPFDQSSYPMALQRPMTAGGGSSSHGFSIDFVLTVSGAPTATYGINMYNPPASNIVFVVYSAQVKQSGAGFVIANIYQRTDGVDNFPSGNTVTIFTHDITGASFISLVHGTFFNNTAIVTPANVPVMTHLVDSDNFEFLGPPDSVNLNPGQNLLMNVQNPVANSQIAMMTKWTEQG